MNQERLLKIIVAPITSEKTNRINANLNQVTFQVLPSATKSEIKEAIEFLFNVQVNAVRVTNLKGKIKRSKQGIGQRKDWKKAYISLKSGHSIDTMGLQ